MTNEQARAISDSALNQLMDSLDRGQSETLKSFLASMSRFHRYSWSNSLLIHSQMPTATRVAGFQSWLKLRRFVRKGEKGLVILAPMIGRKKTAEEDSVDNAGTRVFGFRAAYVFDVSQTDGEPLPEFAGVQGNPCDFTPRLKAYLQSESIELEYDDRIAPAYGTSSGGKITLRPGLEPAEEFSVLVHETAHELLHRGERRKETSHTVRETEAEAVAFVVSTAIGLDPGTASSDYIQLHRGDRATLSESLALIQQTATGILQAIVPSHDGS